MASRLNASGSAMATCSRAVRAVPAILSRSPRLFRATSEESTMAQPIELKFAPRDPKRELLERLEQAPAEHAAALLDGYDLLQELHEQGAFVLVRGMLGAKDKILED